MKFQCKHTGLIYEYFTEHDISEMLKHDEYILVEEEDEPKPKQPKPKKEKQ